MKKFSVMRSKMFVTFAKEELYIDENEKTKFNLHCKVKNLCHYTEKFRRAAQSIFNLRYKVPREIPVKIHNGSTYDYRLIIIELSKILKGQFDCLGENIEK